MKKILALLCAVLLLAASCAFADTPVVEFREKIQLSGSIPEGYSFTLLDQQELMMSGQVISDNPAAPYLEVYIAFNESYAAAESLKDLDENTVSIIKQGFTEEYDVTFGQFETASGDSLLLIRDNGGLFVDFYTVSIGHEIELTLFPAEGQTLTEAQVNSCLELMRTLDIVPILG